MKPDPCCIAVYEEHWQADEALKALQNEGFDMKRLSVVGRDYHTDDHVHGYYITGGDRVKFWGKLGAFWGGLLGLAFDAAFFWVPGIGPLLVAGPLVGALLGALEGAAVGGGLSALGAAFYDMGIPEDSIVEYEDAIKENKFVMVLVGSSSEVEHARNILEASPAQEVVVHNAA